MYDYVAKELGFKVKPSYDQTTLGKKFWAKHQGEKTVWEDQINELFQPKQHWKWTYLTDYGAGARFEVKAAFTLNGVVKVELNISTSLNRYV
jgi:hypothetical protein